MEITIEIRPKYNSQGVPKCGLLNCEMCIAKEAKHTCLLMRDVVTAKTTCDPAWENYKEEKQHEHKGLWQLLLEAIHVHHKNTNKRMKIEEG